MKRFLLLLAALALSATPAFANVTGPSDLVKYTQGARVPLPDAELVSEPCPDQPIEFYDACTIEQRVYIDPEDQAHMVAQLGPDLADMVTRGVILHELGHVYARTTMPTHALDRFARMTHHRSWWLGGKLEERFADAYANCALGTPPSSDLFLDGYGWEPTPKQHRRVCRMIRDAS